MVGARAATFSGHWDAQQLSVGLGLREITIVAASSQGVSRMALAGTLGNDGGAVAVFGSGLDDPYPRTPNGFFDSIAQGGILLSETPPGIEPSRNSLQGVSRMVAALSAVTTVVESGPRGQAMDAVAHALQMRRRVGAVRGPEDEIGSIGPNMLLDQGAAEPVMDRADILAVLESFRGKSESISDLNERPQQACSAIPEELQNSRSLRAPERGISRSL